MFRYVFIVLFLNGLTTANDELLFADNYELVADYGYFGYVHPFAQQSCLLVDELCYCGEPASVFIKGNGVMFSYCLKHAALIIDFMADKNISEEYLNG